MKDTKLAVAKALAEVYSKVVKEHGEDATLVGFATFGLCALAHIGEAHPYLLSQIAKPGKKPSCPPEPSA